MINESESILFGQNVNNDIKCLCIIPEDVETSLIIMKGEIDTSLEPEYLSCKVNNIARCCNLVNSEKLKYYDPFRLAFTDLFYRIRHETLFKAICITLGLNSTLSDKKFSDFGIDSNRTPDYIGYHSDSLCIIEVTATSSFEKGAQQKGLESAGFESKYSKEIKMALEKNSNVRYIPFIFEMSTLDANEYKTTLYECLDCFPNISKGTKVLDYIVKEFKIMTLNLKDSLMAPSSLLFSKPISITENHEKIKFIYGNYKSDEKEIIFPEYQEQRVSSKVYSKIINSWETLLYKLRRMNNESNYKLIINMVTNRIYFDDIKSGLNKDTWYSIIESKNKHSLFTNTLLDFNGDLKQCLGSDTGFSYITSSIPIDKKSRTNDVRIIINDLGHDTLLVKRSGFDLTIYKQLQELNNEKAIKPNYYKDNFDEDYLDMIRGLDNHCMSKKEDIYQFNEKPIFLGENRIKDYKILEVMDGLKKLYISKNKFDDQLPLKKRKTKAPFILPLSEINQSHYVSHKVKNSKFITSIMDSIIKSNPFTHLILSKTLNDDYKFGEENNQPSQYLNELIMKRSEINREMTYIYKCLVKEHGFISSRVADLPDSPLRTSYLELKSTLPVTNKTIDEQYKIERIKRNISMIRLKTKKIKKTKDNPHPSENFLTSLYKQEMLHFKDRTVQSTIEGVGIRNSINSDYNYEKGLIKEITELLPINCGYNPDILIDLNVQNDCKLLKECKEFSINEFKSLVDEVRSSYLGHAAALVSRMSHSLLFYSQLPFNSDYIRVDNLGYKDVLLIVKGGKKIFKTKSSKLYRLIYPISQQVLKLFINPSCGESSFTHLIIEGRNYLMTPWMLMHESILNDALSFYSRVTSFAILNSDPKLSYSKQYLSTSINILLAFHNRRKTETLLANLRYILLSTIGEFSAFSGILQDFVGFNYDLFQSYIRNSIVLNYPEYFKTICSMNLDEKRKNKEIKNYHIKNIFTDEKINKVDDLAVMIYSTFLMTKAPYQRNVERANNLKGILEIHDDFDKNVGLLLNPKDQFDSLNVNYNGDSEKYVKCLFENDYKFDACMLTQLGIFADSYFKNKGCEEKIFSIWSRILNENWDNMATSTGLRGRLNDVENFWGKKGYFVVYKEITKDFSYMESVESMIKCETLDDDQKRKMLRKNNQTFYEKMSKPNELLIFHAVDKTQWRGGREIYVMDIDTKIAQQPIEKFMGELCKLLDNELISIPSDRRAQTIHHTIFEKDLPLKDAITYYLTLDCSKWAPKSVFIKFCLMLVPMSTIPSSFKTHFFNYIEKLYSKRIYFNLSEVLVLKNNPSYKDAVEKHLKFDESVKGYYLEMPYSWVMGIFNYTSSFLHAINQKYMSYIITQSSLENYGQETSLVMFAHSDDSGGRISSSNPVLIQRGLVIYEIGLKACNHLLSRKKSTVSRVYFEILSVIYMFKQLLALLPKFLGGIRFLPTDKGMAQDMLQSYSKSIEVMVAGADFSIAYLVQKIYSMLVWKFYTNRLPTKEDYERPVQFLGMPDAHPLIILISGSDSDIIRIMHVKGEDYMNKLIALTNNIFNTYNEEGPVRSVKFQIQIRNAVKGFENEISKYEGVLSDWAIKNVNFKTTPFSLLNFLSKLNDPGFVGSLMNESPIRRISRSYYLRVGLSVSTKYGPKSLKFAMDTLSAICAYSNSDITLKRLLNETLEFEDKLKFEREITDLISKMKVNMDVFKMSTYNVQKVYKYFEQITLQGKEMLNTNRTLKPTHLEIIKTSKPFSTEFNPSQLVAYTKNSNYKWALPNVNNLINAEIELDKLLDVHSLNKDEIDESTLLKLLNVFTGKSVKEIYLYSHVPSEIRSMRTYSSLLSFLAVNTRKGKEISGLVLKLQSDLTDPGYLPLQIDENIYILNTFIISLMVISKIYGWSFLSKLTIKECEVLDVKGGNIEDFISEILTKYNENYHLPYLLPLINYVKQKMDWPNRKPTGSIFNGGCYYTFTKSQKLSSGWYGKGEIVIVIQHTFFKFEIMNNMVINSTTNVEGKLEKMHSDYLIDVLTSNDIFIDSRALKPWTEIKTDFSFGYDHSGDLRVSEKREIKTGIECIFRTSPGGDLAHLSDFFVEHTNDNIFLLRLRGNELKSPIKIRTMKLLKGELLNTLRLMLNPNDFKDKLESEGIESFDDFLLTEVLTYFGGENYIRFEDFIDNCQSSRLYSIMKWEQENDILPDSTIKFGNMPGTVGSLVYTFLKYGQSKDDWIIKEPKIINRALMNIRSEYPENFTMILRDKLEENFEELYNLEERTEIKNAYTELLQIQDPEKVQKKLIELMCYWGYASMVNTVQCFTALKKKENYQMFKISGYNMKEERIYADLFPKMVTMLNKCALNYQHLYREINYPFKKLAPGKGGIEEVVINNVKGVVASLYKCDVLLCSSEIYHCKYLNLIHALFNEPEFLNELDKEFGSEYPFSLIPLNLDNIYEFIATYNTLKTIWYNVNQINYDLNFTKQVERLPNNVPSPFKFYKEFSDLLTPADTYFHGMMNRETVAKMANVESFMYHKVNYIFKNKICKYSDVKVPIFKNIETPLPLKEEVFEHENWEEIIAESEMVDLDMETIEMYWDEIEDKFQEMETIIEDNCVEAEVNWIIDLGCENKIFDKYGIRQVGEFIIIVTTRLGIMSDFTNCHMREMYLQGHGKTRINLCVYVLLPPGLDNTIVDKLFGKNQIDYNTNTEQVLQTKLIRTPDGLSGATEMGLSFEEINEKWKIQTPLIEPVTTKSVLEGQIEEMKQIIEDSKKENPSMCGVYDRLFLKYREKIGSSITLSNEALIESLLSEINLNEMNSQIKSGSLDLTKEQIINMHLSPSHFGITKGTKFNKVVDFKDKKIKAELESFEQNLGDKIGSGSLTISPKYRKIIESNLDIWKVYVNNTSHKQESKKFLWNLISKICIDATSVETGEDDDIWKEIIEKSVNILAEKGEDLASDSRRPFKLTLRQGARLKYYQKGQ